MLFCSAAEIDVNCWVMERCLNDGRGFNFTMGWNGELDTDYAFCDLED